MIGHRTVCTREHHGFDRSLCQTDWEYPTCGLRDRDIREWNGWGGKWNRLTIIISPRHVVPSTGFVTSELVHGFGQGPLRLAELDHAWLEVVQWSINKAGFFLVMS